MVEKKREKKKMSKQNIKTKKMFSLFSKLGGRKNSAFLFGIVILTTALFTKFLTGAEYITGFGIALSIYTGGNVWQKRQ